MADIELQEGGELTYKDEVEVVHHESRRKKRGAKDPADMDLNLTSMIDVIFQLLIYFILTINFIIDEGSLQSKLPGGGVAEGEQGEEFRIEIAPAAGSAGMGGRATYNFNNRTYTSAVELRAALQAAWNAPIDPEKDSIIIAPQPEVRWNHVLDAFNQCIYTQYTLVNFAPVGD